MSSLALSRLARTNRSLTQKRRIIPVAGLRWVSGVVVGMEQKVHLAVEKGVTEW
jgi:hypothetical protein